MFCARTPLPPARAKAGAAPTTAAPAANLDQKAAQQRLFERCMPEPNSGCWLWTENVTQGGYGYLDFNCRRWRAHRLAYAAFVGPFDESLVVCHRCDTPSCINPDHLWLGTQGDNVRDCARKHRYPVGANHPRAKLSERDVIAVRRLHALGVMQKRIAQRYGVSESAIGSIIRREVWKCV